MRLIVDKNMRLVPSAVDLGVRVDTTLRFHEHVREVANKASGLASNLLRSTCNRDPDFMRQLFISHVRPILEYCSCLWNTGYRGDLRLLESVQRSWTKKIYGFEELPYSERLSRLDLFSVRGRLLRYDLIKVWKIFAGESPISPLDLFTMAPNVGTRGHRYKISHERCRLSCRANFFSVRVVSLWNSLPESAVTCQTVESFKGHLHSHLGEALFEFVG